MGLPPVVGEADRPQRMPAEADVRRLGLGLADPAEDADGVGDRRQAELDQYDDGAVAGRSKIGYNQIYG